MKKHPVIAVLLVSSLAACSLTRSGSGNPAEPQVSLLDNGLSVSPEPLHFGRDQKDVQIVWQLPKGTALRFPANGIVIEGELTHRLLRGARDAATPGGKAPDSVVLDADQKEIVDCRIRNEGLEFSCLNRHTRPGIFKYTIRVVQAGRTIELDPAVMND